MPSRCVATTKVFPVEVGGNIHRFHDESRDSDEVRKVQKNRATASGKSVVNRRQPAAPQQVNMDTLGGMSDEDLINHLRSLHEGLDHAYETRGNSRLWEEEIAYVRREQQIRRERRAAHDAYIRTLEREFAISEAGLPVADLDNSAFLEFNR
jgi:hypothetical protein